ncbi:3520_t:CDS:2 [Funneliformis mosseae]|uniref:3520_t:CDS:1 n=1 Tax=Funneliformis mosseae TaxID=27381 RepID=A0A9N9EZM6_FUNMO|nr:3520_t:CDS:2 [Funneliformis mosseae]
MDDILQWKKLIHQETVASPSDFSTTLTIITKGQTSSLLKVEAVDLLALKFQNLKKLSNFLQNPD